MSSVRKLRVGVVLDSLKVPAWHLEVLRSLHQSETTEVALVMLDNSPRYVPPILHRLAKATFASFDPQATGCAGDACVLVSGAELLEDVPRIHVAPSGRDDAQVDDSIRANNLDLILTLVGGDALSRWRSLARLGLMYFHINGKPFNPHDGSMVGLAETLWRKPCLATTLELAPSNDNDCRVAYETHSPVDHRSHAITRNQHLWKCSTFPTRALRECVRLGCDTHLASLPTAVSKSPGRKQAWAALIDGAGLVPALLSYAAWRVWQKAYSLAFTERWILLTATRGEDFEHATFTGYTPPPARFWADPHAIESGGDCFVFFEDADRNTGIGHIAVADVSGTGELSRPRMVLSRPYHLSYPFVFKWNECHYLVPESAANRTVELYRCVRFPDEWAFSHNLIEDISAFDATLLEHEGRWWMFANVKERDEASTWDELHLFWADSPISRRWNAHPANPVISDVRSARPGGPIFSRDGLLLRPSQDSSGRYGRALNINQIIELSTSTYREILITQVGPGRIRNALAVHSYSTAGKHVFIDAVVPERRQGAATR